MSRACSTVEERKEVHTEFWWGKLREVEGLPGRPTCRWEGNIKWIFEKWDRCGSG
jgi:hypothetical protein